DPIDPSLWNSVADWFRTSIDPLSDGTSWQGYAAEAFVGYANYRGYEFNSWSLPDYLLDWQGFTSEIDAGRPMMFLVDTNGDDLSDHFVPVLGYEDRGDDGLWYGVYTTWGEGESISWKEFRYIDDGVNWGIDYATFILPLDPLSSDHDTDPDGFGGQQPVPEPATMLLFGAGMIGLAGLGRKKFFKR
ncbi:MAG: PEP-CTERM sorting domain-containing protein, partial [Deltaproteobacteria bacterium]|nr:PEP-CTERM sorting domain-containing protein [Deltaproteobacteria bacterium]